MYAKVVTDTRTISEAMESLGVDTEGIKTYTGWVENGMGRIIAACSDDGGIYGMAVLVFLPNPDVRVKHENPVMIYEYVIDKECAIDSILEPIISEAVKYSSGRLDTCIDLLYPAVTVYLLTHGFTDYVWGSGDECLAAMSYTGTKL